MMKIDWKYQLRQYAVALILAALIFVSLSLYIFFRRGYYDLYIANKAFAGDAAMLLGIIFLLGPLSRFFAIFDRYIQYRKEIGMVAFFLALAHSLVSFFFLPSKFTVGRYLSAINWPFIFGLTGLILLVILFFISNGWMENKIGAKRWWWLQNWSLRLVVILTVLHVFVMKYAGWIRWYAVGGESFLAHPELPGGGLLVGWFLVFALLVRGAEFGGVKFGRMVWYLSVIGLPVVYLFTFWWGLRFRVDQSKRIVCMTRDQVDEALEAKSCLVIFETKVYDLTAAVKWDLTGHVGKHLCGKEYDKETIEKGPHNASVMEKFLVGELCP
jgi:DMSO/TMAO reductase YedYZ heme-binding membrane subunit/predicted heme/steroid binding protein